MAELVSTGTVRHMMQDRQITEIARIDPGPLLHLQLPRLDGDCRAVSPGREDEGRSHP